MFAKQFERCRRCRWYLLSARESSWRQSGVPSAFLHPSSCNKGRETTMRYSQLQRDWPTWRERLVQCLLAVDGVRPNDLREITVDFGEELVRGRWNLAVVAVAHGELWNTGSPLIALYRSCFVFRVMYGLDLPYQYSRDPRPTTQYIRSIIERELVRNFSRAAMRRRRCGGATGCSRRRSGISFAPPIVSVRSIIAFICQARYERFCATVIRRFAKLSRPNKFGRLLSRLGYIAFHDDVNRFFYFYFALTCLTVQMSI